MCVASIKMSKNIESGTLSHCQVKGNYFNSPTLGAIRTNKVVVQVIILHINLLLLSVYPKSNSNAIVF